MRKSFFIFLQAAIIIASYFLTSCEKAGKEPAPLQITSSISFSIPTDGIDAASVKAIIFDENGLFYETISPEYKDGIFGFELPAGNYGMQIVANSGMDTQLGNLEKGVSTYDEFTAFTFDRQLTDEESIPWISRDMKQFEITESGTTALGTIEIMRTAARIDILNAVNSLTISKIILKNAVMAGSITGEMPSGDIYKDAVYESLDMAGNPEKPEAFSIYTYDNLLADETHTPAVEITYTYAGEQVTEQFLFLQEESPVAIVRGKLYCIQLTETDPADYSVATWEDGASSSKRFSMQEALNKKLAINHFTQTNVHSFDFDNHTFTFCKTVNSLPSDNEDASWFGNWDESFKDEFTGDDGRKYRLPTFDEMKLFGSEKMFRIWWNSRNEDDLGIQESIGDLFSVVGSGGNGTSDLRCICDADGDRMYGIRFQNTLQQAAYRYQSFQDDIDNAYVQIKVKAVGMDIPSLDEISDESYWESEYLEFRFPLTGRVSGQNRGEVTRLWTGTEDPSNAKKIYFLSFEYNELRLNTKYKTDDKINVRMVSID